MPKYRDLDRGDVLPASFLDAMEEYIATGAFNLTVKIQSSTVLRVPASSGNDQVGVGIEGLWRFISANKDASHPGGSAGTYDVWVTTGENDFSDTPDPDTDDTDYTFALTIKAQSYVWGGGDPPHKRKIATCTWNGSAITDVRMADGLGGLPAHASTHNPSGADALDWSAIAQVEHLRGTLAARPAAAAGNTAYLYLATDVNGGTLYRSTGSTWEKTALGAAEVTSSQGVAQAVLLFGTFASRPSATSGNQYYYYFATDTKALYQNQSGSAWATLFVTASSGDVSGDFPSLTVLKASGAFALPGVISPTTLAADANNYNPSGLSTASVIRLAASADVDITGLAGGASGRLIVLRNVGTRTITLKGEHSNSTDTNRFSGTGDLALGPGENCVLQYDSTLNRWTTISQRFTGAPVLLRKSTPSVIPGTTETDIFASDNWVIQGGALGSRKTLRVHLEGTYFSPTSGASPRFRVVLGGVQLLDTGTAAVSVAGTSAGQRRQFTMTIVIFMRNATNKVRASLNAEIGKFDSDWSDGVGSVQTGVEVKYQGASSSDDTVDMTANQQLQVFATVSGGSRDLTIDEAVAVVE